MGGRHFLCVLLAVGSQVWVLLGDRTPAALRNAADDTARLSSLSVLPAKLTVQQLLNQWTTALSDLPLAIVDATFSALDSRLISDLAAERDIVHLVLGYQSEPANSSFHVSGTFQQLADAVRAFLLHYEWSRVNVAVDETEISLAVQRHLRSALFPVFDSIGFFMDSEENVRQKVGRQMKLTGNRVAVLLTEAETTQRVMVEQERQHIGGKGFADITLIANWLLPANVRPLPEAILSTGSIIIAEEELVECESQEEMLWTMLKNAVQLLADYTDTEQLKDSLYSRFPGGNRQPSFSVINMQAGKKVTVGTIRNSVVSIHSPIHFLGNSTSIPQNSPSPLVIGANFGIRNYNSINLVPQLYYNGAVLAVDDINTRRDILQNFRVELFNFTAGVQVWDYQFALNNVLPIKDKLGLAIISSFASDVSIQFSKLLLDLNISKVLVGSANTVDTLSSRSQFPMYVRTIVPDRYTVSAYIQMFKYFGFKRCGLFVSSDLSGRMFRSTFLEMAEENGIQVINDPEMQLLPSPLPNIDALKNCTANFQDLIDSQAQILLISMIDGAILAVDFLYEMGIRGGDIQFVANKWLSPSIIASNDTETNRRRSELLRGAIQFSLSGFSGEFGTKVKSDFVHRFGQQPDLRSCFFYDSALALAYALEIAIHTGRDFTDSEVLNTALRGTKFKGCSGTVYFSSDTNDRAPMSYDILNAIAGSNEIQLNITTVGTYDPSSSLMFRFSRDIVWSDGTTNIPKDLRQSTINCPFEDRLIHSFEPGKRLFSGLTSGIVALVMILSALFFHFFYNFPLVEIEEKREIQILDVIIYFTIAIEMLQLLSFGPSAPFQFQAVQFLIDFCAFDFHGIVLYNNGIFTIIWLSVFVGVVLWLLFVMLLACNLDYRLRAVPGISLLGDISELMVPLWSEWLYAPFTSILLEVYRCEKAVAASSSDIAFSASYLHADCYVNCWQGTHRLMLAASSLALALFIPIAICFRPIWQEIQTHINVKSSGQFLMLKSVLQVLVIVLCKVLKDDHPLAHSAVFFTLVSIFAGYTLRWNCFSYCRARLWHRVSVLAVQWTAALSLLEQLLPDTYKDMWKGLNVLGWSACVWFGIVYQGLRLPSYLYSKSGIDAKILFQFAFQRTTRDLIAALRESFHKAGHRSIVDSRKVQDENLRSERSAGTEGKSIASMIYADRSPREIV